MDNNQKTNWCNFCDGDMIGECSTCYHAQYELIKDEVSLLDTLIDVALGNLHIKSLGINLTIEQDTALSMASAYILKHESTPDHVIKYIKSQN